MNQSEHQSLQRFLTTFQVNDLGEGDINAGVNLLAAMALTLANLAPVDESVCLPHGAPVHLGASLLVSGAVSSGRIVDEVLAEAALVQTYFTKHLLKHQEWILEVAQKPALSPPPTGPAVSANDQLLSQVLSEIEPLMGTRQEMWNDILRTKPGERFHDLAHRPKFLVSAARPRDLESQLKALRPGRPLIHFGIQNSADFSELAEPGAALISGNYPLGNGWEIIRGNFLLTDPLGLINQAANPPDHRASWLGHFLWLVDGDEGPDAPIMSPKKGNLDAAYILAHFRNALSAVISTRINLSGNRRQPLRFDTRAGAHRWTAFLREMEPRMPGISGAARNLINSLVFGLGEIGKLEKSFNFTLEEVEAFCQFLVRRAVNARNAILNKAEISRQRALAEKIYRRIEQGCNDRRIICKNTGINTACFDECVSWLEDAGLVQRSEAKSNHWVRVEGTKLNFRDCRLPLLEID